MVQGSLKIFEGVIIADDRVRLTGRLATPQGASGLVVFAHGASSSRFSPRNLLVAELFNRGGMATLLFDLLSGEEASEREAVFDIGLLARRLLQAARWARSQPDVLGLPMGFFGASTGAAAALVAAAELGPQLSAIVSRGGRPDLAEGVLDEVRVPTLLIVGGEDTDVVELNRAALKRLVRGRLSIVPGATHLFEEPGALAEVAHEAESWFIRYLAGRGRRAKQDVA